MTERIDKLRARLVGLSDQFAAEKQHNRGSRLQADLRWKIDRLEQQIREAKEHDGDHASVYPDVLNVRSDIPGTGA